MAISRTSVPGASRLATLYCSFCRKDKGAVTKLIAGPGVYICNECVGLCNLILGAEAAPPGNAGEAENAGQAGEQAPGLGAWDEHPDEELLAGLGRVQAVVAQADAAVYDYVGTLRDRGISCTLIGEALGVSKQAAWERFSGED